MSTSVERSVLSYFKGKEARNFDSPENESITLERLVHDENGEAGLSVLEISPNELLGLMGELRMLNSQLQDNSSVVELGGRTS